MLQVKNQTPFSASLSVFPDRRGIECAFANIKATFALNGNVLEPAEKQLPLLATDVHWGEPATTSLRAAADLCLLKPATDILISGHAFAPNGTARSSDLHLQVGALRQSWRIFGQRRWEKIGERYYPGQPESFERLPLCWEHAFGGTVRNALGETLVFEETNPVGKGLLTPEQQEKPDGLLLPCIEDPACLIQSPSDRPSPRCPAPIAVSWMPRRGFAGTYDEVWQQQRAPYLPDDFDPRFLLVAAPELTVPGYLKGGEPVAIQGASPNPLNFNLPTCDFLVEFRFAGRRLAQPVVLDTVVFEPGMNRVQMVWRAGLAVDKKLTRLTEVEIRCRQYARQEAAA